MRQTSANEYPRPLISIVICTQNRSEDLERCLYALCPQVDSRYAEIIVIDNNSNSAELSENERIVHSHSGVELVKQKESGVSLARNLAVEISAGSWLAFLDDDTVPHPNYFESAMAVLRDIPDNVAVWGGRLLPRWPVGFRNDIGERWRSLLSLIEDETDQRSAETGLIYSANAFYRLDVLRKFDVPFDPKLGRIGRCLLSGEETSLQYQISKLGFDIRYYGSVCVEHVISPSRLKLSWLKDRSYWDGITLVAVCRATKEPYPRGANPFIQAVKILYLLPKMLLKDDGRDAYAIIWTSVGVIRARLFGMP